jgi:hypothetical protein
MYGDPARSITVNSSMTLRREDEHQLNLLLPIINRHRRSVTHNVQRALMG